MSTRYRIRPGYVAVRRDETRLQIGIDPPRRAIVQDGVEVRRLLTDLAVGRATEPDHLPGRHAMQQLGNAGLLVEADGDEPPPRIGFDGPPALVAGARSLVSPAPAAPSAPEIVVLLSEGPLDRERADDLVRDGRPHLVVESGPDTWTVGPLIVPGVTACLRCVDATLAEEDDRRAVVVSQLVGIDVPSDPLLRCLALSWAVRDARAYLAGRTPASWSTSLVLTRDDEPTVRPWLRHPYCGCAWDLIASTGDGNPA
ncbi:hypothetical protein J2S40_002955 [Nocardioides luteus]|uniref:Cyclodehydratase n=1 Tax=Nocardioides luteus TaxID=1844 RepID=A0ABQ5SWC3_9ACTN|nr:hypothetical protein [Nocardioides luteus]MDR7311897.1 hypothetical protein [Nocardioides luteus]GGR67103.1 cyclodehydratase [Nocardioides luteus]GLJ68141.1 cyclodehydratase [Nocardioides luteus]